MNNQEWDNLLNIQTTNERDWQASIYDYHRLESTDYDVLSLLFNNLRISKNDRFVDMGCGTGRALFYMHYRFGINVTGVELHPMTFNELEENLQQYQNRFKVANNVINLEHTYADDYIINSKDTIFYFFNPFSIKIFKNVVDNILDSVRLVPRSITLILYYPERIVINYLKNETAFTLEDKIKIPGTHDSRDFLHIFTL